MPSFDATFDHVPVSWATIPYLLGALGLLVSWFPGHNARVWGQGCPRVVAVCGWIWGIVCFGLSLLHASPIVIPVMALIWVTITTWSYGRAAHRPAARAAGGFEVVRPAIDLSDMGVNPEVA